MDLMNEFYDQGKKLNIAAIVLAGGRGKRMQSDTPKQYLEIQGRPVLYYSLKAFQDSPVDTIVLVCAKGEASYCKEQIVDRYGFHKVKYIAEGGAERYHSVFNGLQWVKDSDYVLIHDGARPFVTEKIIRDNISVAIEKKACVTGVPSKDTVKLSDDCGKVASTPPRKNVWLIQTPQSFATPLIYNAYEQIMTKTDITVTDDAMVVETALGAPVYFVMGDYRNIKITTPEDLQVAQVFVEEMFR